MRPCGAPSTDSTGTEPPSTLATRRRERVGRGRAEDTSTICSSDTQWPLSGKQSWKQPTLTEESSGAFQQIRWASLRSNVGA